MKDEARVQAIAGRLHESYASTTYAGMGALLAAHNAETAGKYAEAEKALKWIVDSDKYPELKPLASVRLAGVYLDEGKYDQGLTVLNAVKELKAKKFLFMTVWATSISPKAMLPLLVKAGKTPCVMRL